MLRIHRLCAFILLLLHVAIFTPFQAELHADQTGLMLPKAYEGQVVDEKWFWSEKLDGIRGEWTGTEMLTKQGHKIHVPTYFVQNFPTFPLSGEIWGGRQTFEQTSSIVATSHRDKGWHRLKFGIFDAKDTSLPIEKRLAKAEHWFQQHPSEYAFVIQQAPVKNKEHLQQLLTTIEAQGGEGIVLIKKGSKYENGRSVNILKVKNFDDAEAIVTGYVKGKGRHRGRMGALEVELHSNRNIRFKIGTGFSDAQRISPPPIGSLITFKHTGYYKSGKPKFPSFIRVRSLTGEMF